MEAAARPPVRACRRVRLACPLLRFVSMATSLVLGIAIDAIIGLDVIRFLVTGPHLLLAGIIGLRLGGGERDGRDGGGRCTAECPEEVASAQCRLLLVLHLPSSSVRGIAPQSMRLCASPCLHG